VRLQSRYGGIFRPGSLGSGKISTRSAARILHLWAVSAPTDERGWIKAMLPLWIADAIDDGYTSEDDVYKSIHECLDYFAGVRNSK
jgi:hypothetical protein